jgi:hypothetical protein
MVIATIVTLTLLFSTDMTGRKYTNRSQALLKTTRRQTHLEPIKNKIIPLLSICYQYPLTGNSNVKTLIDCF